MKNKIIAILLFIPLLLVGLVYSLSILFASVSDADRIIIDLDVMNVIRIGETQRVNVKVLPEKYSSDLILISSDESIISVNEPSNETPYWTIEGVTEGEVEITAKLKDSKSLASDSVFFYSYALGTNKILTYDVNNTKRLIDYSFKYGEFDLNKDEEKVAAEFTLKTIDVSGTTVENPLPSQECDIEKVTSNLEVSFSPTTYEYKVTILSDKDSNGESYIEFKSKTGNTTERYEVDVVDNAINVRNYNDLMYCTNKSETGEKIVLQTNLESAQNTFENYDINNKNKLIDIENASKHRSTELFGKVRTTNGKNYYYMDDYLTMETTYDHKYLNFINEKYGLNISKDVKIGVQVQQDLYGNGFTINMHSLTFPSGEGTQTSQGITNIYPNATDAFQGAVDFVAITFNELSDSLSSYKPLASVAGQDNIGLLVKGDNISIENVEIKSCNNVNHLSNLEYVGTTVEVMGNNVEIVNSLIQNGRCVLRSFSNENLVVRNSLLRFGRDFIIKVGSNSNYYSEFIGDYPDWSEDERYDNEITLDNVYTQSSGFFSLGIDTHFNGEALIEGDPMFLSGATRLGASSKGTKVNIINNTKFYDWKDYSQLDTSTLIQFSKGIDQSLIDAVLQRFNISELIKEQLVGENERFIYPVEEQVFDNKGNPVLDAAGNNTYKTIEYVHGGVAFYGGGKNYSTMIQTDDELLSLGLHNLGNISLTGLISSFSGSEPFSFYMYDKFGDIIPSSSPNINDLRENCHG